MRIRENEDKTFDVLSGSEVMISGLKSHSEAWRWIDRYEGDPVSRAEKVSEFLYNKQGMPE